ncbi:hypothetical protein ACRQ5Q_08670 [Bradyrhizobium sp. PMVTL-01]|uniref:hypothetical protein n=1 Tax=Bradyrhizobium sp. PMVTL-01 TaxID=3434999 RepID=UPI003F6EE93C
MLDRADMALSIRRQCMLLAKYLSDKARKDRWAWNFGIKLSRPITVRENRQWKPAVAGTIGVR